MWGVVAEIAAWALWAACGGWLMAEGATALTDVPVSYGVSVLLFVLAANLVWAVSSPTGAAGE